MTLDGVLIFSTKARVAGFTRVNPPSERATANWVSVALSTNDARGTPGRWSAERWCVEIVLDRLAIGIHEDNLTAKALAARLQRNNRAAGVELGRR